MAKARQAEHWADPQRADKAMCGIALENLDRVVPLNQPASCTCCRICRNKREAPKRVVRKSKVHWEDPLLNVRGYFRCRTLAAKKTANTQKRSEITCDECAAAYDQQYGVNAA